MTGMDSQKRVKTPGAVYLISAITAVGGFLFGYDTGVISGALLFIKEDFALSPIMEGVVVSSILGGAIVGAFGCGPLSDKWGRRRTLVGIAIVFAIGSLAAAFAWSVTVLVAARIILGLSVGGASVLVPLYIAEAAPPRLRGRLVSLNQLLITIGILTAYLINSLFAYDGGWRWMFGLGMVPAFVLGVGMLFLPETPRWLVEKGRLDEARAVLNRIRDRQTASQELREIEEARKADTDTSNVRDLLQPWVRPALIAGVGVAVIGQASGINTVIYYAPTILKDAGLGTYSAILATSGIGVVNVVMTLVGMSLIDKAGRRKLLIFGFSVMTACLIALGIVFHYTETSSTAGILAVVCLAVYIAAFAASVGVVVFVLPSEIYPQKIRGAAMSATLMSNWGMNLLVALTFLSLIDALGPTVTFWLFAAVCALGIFYAVKLVPETKGRSLEEIEHWMRSKAQEPN